MSENDLFLTPAQLYELRRVRQWAADFRYAQRILREGRDSQTAQELLEDC